MVRKIKVEDESITMPVRIRLKGKWLERAGFKPGTHAEIKVEFGRLTIVASGNGSSQAPHPAGSL